MTISYNATDNRIEISGAETWDTLRAWLDANPTHKVYSNNCDLEPNKMLWVTTGATLTVTSRCITISIDTVSDNYSPIRAPGGSNRGKLILRDSARVSLYGSTKPMFQSLWPDCDYEDSTLVFNRGLFNNETSFWPDGASTRIKNTEVRIHSDGSTAQTFSQTLRVTSGGSATVEGLTISAKGGFLLLFNVDSDGIVLRGGVGLGGSYDPPALGVYHKNMRLTGAAQIAFNGRRGQNGYVFYNVNSGTQRIWQLRYNTNSSGVSAAQASVSAIVWKFAPAVVDAAGTGIAGVRWYVEGEAGAPFVEQRSGLTGATGYVVPSDGGSLAWGGHYSATYERIFSEPNSALILKSRTPANNYSVPLDNLVIPSFRYALRKYGLRPQETSGHTGDVDVTGPVLMPADAGCVLSEATAAAVVGVTVDWSNLEIDVTGDVTLDEVYCYLAYQYAQLAQMPYVAEFSASGARVILSGWSVTVSGTLSGGTLSELEADSIVSSGTLTDIVTITPGETLGYVTIVAPGLIAGSRVQLYDVGNAVEIYNGVLAVDGLAYSTTWSADRTIRLRAEHTEKLPLQTLGVLTAAGLSILDVQSDDTVYTANAIDGSTCTEFVADGANVQVDISDPDGVTSVQRLYAWAQWYQTTATGIASEFFGAITALDAATYLIDQALADIHLDNVQTTPVRVVGGYLARRDGTTVIAPTSGSIQMDPGKAYVASSDGMARESTVQAVLALSIG